MPHALFPLINKFSVIRITISFLLSQKQWEQEEGQVHKQLLPGLGDSSQDAEDTI